MVLVNELNLSVIKSILHFYVGVIFLANNSQNFVYAWNLFDVMNITIFDQWIVFYTRIIF